MSLVPNGLPLLAVGSHNRNSGLACIMNAIAYMEGDLEISDAPDCVWRPLRDLAIGVNDNICNGCPRELVAVVNNAVLLCPAHSHQMWLLGARLFGSSEQLDKWLPEDLEAAWSAEHAVLSRMMGRLRIQPLPEPWHEWQKNPDTDVDNDWEEFATVFEGGAAAEDMIDAAHLAVDAFDAVTGGYTAEAHFTASQVQTVAEQLQHQ